MSHGISVVLHGVFWIGKTNFAYVEKSIFKDVYFKPGVCFVLLCFVLILN